MKTSFMSTIFRYHTSPKLCQNLPHLTLTTFISTYQLKKKSFLVVLGGSTFYKFYVRVIS